MIISQMTLLKTIQLIHLTALLNCSKRTSISISIQLDHLNGETNNILLRTKNDDAKCKDKCNTFLAVEAINNVGHKTLEH